MQKRIEKAQILYIPIRQAFVWPCDCFQAVNFEGLQEKVLQGFHRDRQHWICNQLCRKANSCRQDHTRYQKTHEKQPKSPVQRGF